MIRQLSILLFALLFCSFSNVCLGEDPTFPFTADQNTKNEDITQIPAEKDIQTDKWFMSPPTRLELLTYAFDQYFKKEFSEVWESYREEKIQKYFEPQVRRLGPPVQPMTDAGVSFYSPKDIFVVGVKISELGRPKKPMKEACSQLLDSYIFGHVAGSGYLYQNTFLGPFIQTSGTDPEILRIVERLRKNVLFMVTLEARFDEEKVDFPRDLFIMQCYKFSGEKEVHYRKQSLRLKLKP
jgi:hypothetical protein